MTELIQALDVHGRHRIREGEMIISSSLRNRRRRLATPPPPCALHVGGPIRTDVKGCYVFAGYLNGKQYYKHRTEDWYIWFRYTVPPPKYNWKITHVLNSSTGVRWNKMTPSYESEQGDYEPAGGATGTAKVENPPS